MNIKEKIRELRFVNRCKKAGIGVIIGKKQNKSVKQEKSFTEDILPCYKSNEEVLEFLTTKYDLSEETANEYDMIDYKVNYILNEKPDILETPEIKFPKGIEATSEQIEEYKINYEKRLDEARKYPLEKLGLNISTYAFYQEISKGFDVKFRILCESNSDEIQVRVSIDDRKVNKSEDEQIRRIIDEVTLYKGITKEDIDNKTANYMIYVAAKKYWLERDKSL